MNINGFLQTYPSVLFGSEGDQPFETLRILTRGHSSPRQAKLLHHAATFLEDKECYLEIGSYSGYTLCSAGLESKNLFIGIDNFSVDYSSGRDDIPAELKNNLNRYLKNYLFRVGDFRSVSLTELDNDQKKIGIFYVDGNHTYEDVIDSVNWALPRFGKDVLLMFDDINVDGVAKGVDKILEDKRYQEIVLARSFFDNEKSGGMASDPYVHNGFSLVVYRGNDGLQ